MKPNVGDTEAKVRIGVGLLAGVLALRSHSRLSSSLLSLVAASSIGTGLARWCPISNYFGIDNAPDLVESPLKMLSKKMENSTTFH